MTAPLQIERIAGTTREVIDAAIARGEHPFVVTGWATQWRAFSLWTLPYLADRIGDRLVKVGVSRTQTFHYGSAELPQTRTRMMSFRAAVTHFMRPEEPGAERLYIMEQNTNQVRSLPEVYPELARDYTFPPGVSVERLQQTNLWIGGAGNTTPLHYDASNNFLTQIVGRKRLTLFDPYQTELLYPHGSRKDLNNTSQLQTLTPDPEKYPLFRAAKPLECVLHPGEMLYLPPFWWHHVESLDPAISINFWWKPRVEQCLTPMGIQMIFYMYDRGELSELLPRDVSEFNNLVQLGRYYLERGYRCVAVLFARAEVERRHERMQDLVERVGAPWRDLLRQAEAGNDTLLDPLEVEQVLRSVEGS